MGLLWARLITRVFVRFAVTPAAAGPSQDAASMPRSLARVRAIRCRCSASAIPRRPGSRPFASSAYLKVLICPGPARRSARPLSRPSDRYPRPPKDNPEGPRPEYQEWAGAGRSSSRKAIPTRRSATPTPTALSSLVIARAITNPHRFPSLRTNQHQTPKSASPIDWHRPLPQPPRPPTPHRAPITPTRAGRPGQADQSTPRAASARPTLCVTRRAPTPAKTVYFRSVLEEKPRLLRLRRTGPTTAPPSKIPTCAHSLGIPLPTEPLDGCWPVIPDSTPRLKGRASTHCGCFATRASTPRSCQTSIPLTPCAGGDESPAPCRAAKHHAQREML